MRKTAQHLLYLVPILSCLMFANAENKPSPYHLPSDITYEQVQKIQNAAVAKAEKEGLLMNVAIVDAGGNLKSFVRMDGAFLASIDISIKKAVTARSLNMSTDTLSKLAQPGQELYGIEVSNNGLMLFGGGELLKNKTGLIIGAIGVSGGSVAEDMSVAKAGVDALLSE